MPKIVDNKPTLGGNIRFTGAAVYWTAWAEGGIKSVESDEEIDEIGDRNDDDGAAAPAIDAPAPDANTTSLKKQYDKRYIIFGEQTWPEKEDVSPLEGGL